MSQKSWNKSTTLKIQERSKFPYFKIYCKVKESEEAEWIEVVKNMPNGEFYSDVTKIYFTHEHKTAYLDYQHNVFQSRHYIVELLR